MKLHLSHLYKCFIILVMAFPRCPNCSRRRFSVHLMHKPGEKSLVCVLYYFHNMRRSYSRVYNLSLKHYVDRPDSDLIPKYMLIQLQYNMQLVVLFRSLSAQL